MQEGSCAVCLEETAGRTPCGHALCASCRDAWLQRQRRTVDRTCPVCRQCIDGELKRMSLRVSDMRDRSVWEGGASVRRGDPRLTFCTLPSGTTYVSKTGVSDVFRRDDVLVSVDGARPPSDFLAVRALFEASQRDGATLQLTVLRRPYRRRSFFSHGGHTSGRIDGVRVPTTIWQSVSQTFSRRAASVTSSAAAS